MEPYEVLESKTMYNGRIINVAQDRITLPDGREAIREVVIHGGAAAILPVDDQGNIIFVRQYRHPAKSHMLEAPAGTLERGEDPYACALRELEEETGYKANKFTFLTKFFSAVGFCTEVLHIYLAEELTPGQQHLDQDEFVTIEKYSLEKAVDMIFSGEIADSKTICAVLCYKEFKGKK